MIHIVSTKESLQNARKSKGLEGTETFHCKKSDTEDRMQEARDKSYGVCRKQSAKGWKYVCPLSVDAANVPKDRDGRNG